jgi:minor extracellular protease Epr
MYASLLLVLGLVFLLYNTEHKRSESDILQISKQHNKIQQWIENQQSTVNPYMNVTNQGQVDDVIDEEVFYQNGMWTVTYQTKTGINPMGMSVTIDNGSGDITSVTEQNRVMILFKDKVNEEVITNSNGQIVEITDEIPMVTATIPTEELEKLAGNPEVLTVEDDQVLTIHQQNMDWGIGEIRLPFSWKYGLTGKGIKIAVVDSGIDSTHQDLSIAGGESFVPYTTSYHDDNGHGTHVAGIIGALNNEIGTVGSAYDSSLYAVKVLDSEGFGYLSEIIAGIDWAISNDMDIINLSLGTQTTSTALKSIVDRAYQNGIIVVASSGNFGSSETIDNVAYPARYESVIAVGAVDTNLRVTDFSSSGKELEVAAPGQSIFSTFVGNTYKKMSGTSMAAPYVTGNLALLKQANPNASVDEIRNILKANIVDLGEFGRDRYYGYGLIQSSPSFSIHGRNRYETSVMISQNGWPNGSNHVLLGRGDIPIDALTGSILASKMDSPILLTQSSKLPTEVRTELQRLKPTSITILGGEAAISGSIEQELIKSGYSVNRISGTTRYDTARKVAEEVYETGEIFLTTGNNSPDPLSIAPYAGIKSSPILLTAKNSLPTEVKQFLLDNKIQKVTIVGGEGAISTGVESQLKEVGVVEIERISGIDRYATSAEIVRKYRDVFSGPIYVASGNSFVDALPGTVLAAKNKSPIVLMHKDYVPESVKEMLKATYPPSPYVSFLGGYGVITIETRVKLESALR